MVMARRQTLVQLDDARIAALDERAASEGLSRSQLIRQAVDLFLGTGDRAAIDREIVEGYRSQPPDEPDYWAVENAISAIKEEPW
jgi:metal-responsive CopG/Arc/MetJ family transcriptional regulator